MRTAEFFRFDLTLDRLKNGGMSSVAIASVDSSDAEHQRQSVGGELMALRVKRVFVPRCRHAATIVSLTSSMVS